MRTATPRAPLTIGRTGRDGQMWMSGSSVTAERTVVTSHPNHRRYLPTKSHSMYPGGLSNGDLTHPRPRICMSFVISARTLTGPTCELRASRSCRLGSTVWVGSEYDVFGGVTRWQSFPAS